MKPSRYGYLARIAYMHSMNEKEICKGKQSVRFIVNLLMSYKKKKKFLTYLSWKEQKKKHAGEA